MDPSNENEFDDLETAFTIKKKPKSEAPKDGDAGENKESTEQKDPKDEKNGEDTQSNQKANPAWDTVDEEENQKVSKNQNNTKNKDKEDAEEGQVINPLWATGHDDSKDAEVEETKEHHVTFYGKKTNIEQYERRNLETIEMRTYHNWIKSVLINKYTSELKKNYKRAHRRFLDISVLEIGCGTGGDLKKWFHNGISYLLGVDVSRASLDNALQRWSELRGKKFLVDFIKVSAGAPENVFFEHIPNDVYFDMITSQFVIHYLFINERSAENLLTNISKKLCKDGYFICSIPDSDAIVKRIRTLGKKNEDGEIVMGNEFYSIKFKSDRFPNNQPYGIEYGFFLDDSAVGSKTIDENGKVHITYVPEYLIIWDNFVKKAKSYGLELVEHKNFHEFCKESINNEQNFQLMKRMGLEDIGKIPKKLWEISYLYKIAAFRKVEGAEMNYVERNFKDYARCKVMEANEEIEEEITRNGGDDNDDKPKSPHSSSAGELSEDLFQ